MNRTFLCLAGTVALVIVLSTLGRTPQASADDFSLNWDVVLCDGVGGANDPSCTDPTTVQGDNDGIIETNENPEVQTKLMLDLAPAVADEPFFDLANAVWQGIIPTAGTGITDGDQVGEVYFSIESNLVSPLFSNVSAPTGQPPKCIAGASTLSDTFPIYDAELDTNQTVSPGQEFEDNLLADCVTAGQPRPPRLRQGRCLAGLGP
jgi:hypothetical protein